VAVAQHSEREIVVVGDIIDRWWRLFVISFIISPSDLAAPAEAVIASCREHDLPLFRAKGGILHGYAIAHRGDPEAGRTIISKELAAYFATEALLFSSYFRALLAETHRMLGDPDGALSILDEALVSVEQTGEKWYLAELHRRVGEVHRQLGDHYAATQSFEQALAVARSQGARLWELRAATSLARLLHYDGDGAKAGAVLAPVYAWFTEGFDTVPLREARALLDLLGSARAAPRYVTA
jgi:predicted ATPase